MPQQLNLLITREGGGPPGLITGGVPNGIIDE